MCMAAASPFLTFPASDAMDDLKQLQQRIADAMGNGRRLEIRGGGSKRAIGLTDDGADDGVEIIATGGLAGIIDYEPSELVLTLGAGTPLAEVEALLAEHGQMLAFDPFDHGPIFGAAPGKTTIGGVIAAGVAGSRRLTAGGARDHLLGFKAISGRGEIFIGGAKVVKNVTGYDLPKLMAGSWGRLALLAELSLKVLPAPRDRASLMLHGSSDREALAAIARAMRGHYEVAAAAHFPADTVPGMMAGKGALTLLRLEGFRPSVEARLDGLHELLGGVAMRGEEEAMLWQQLRAIAPLADAPLLWRVVVPPASGWKVTEGLSGHDVRWLYDWAGGLIWLAAGDASAPVRDAAAQAGGHAMLVRAPDAARRQLPVFHPEPAAVAALSDRVRRSFDPAGVFRSTRFGELVDAH